MTASRRLVTGLSSIILIDLGEGAKFLGVTRSARVSEVKSFFAALTEDDGWTPQTNRKGEVAAM